MRHFFEGLATKTAERAIILADCFTISMMDESLYTGHRSKSQAAFYTRLYGRHKTNPSKTEV